MSFCLNGVDLGMAFADAQIGDCLFPALSVSTDLLKTRAKCKVNFDSPKMELPSGFVSLGDAVKKQYTTSFPGIRLAAVESCVPVTHRVQRY